MSDLICRKTMRVCETPGMCSPWGGCPPVAEWPAPAAVEVEITRLRRTLAVLDRLAWLAAEEDSWFGDETDIAVQRAAAERHRAALSKTEGKG